MRAALFALVLSCATTAHARNDKIVLVGAAIFGAAYSPVLVTGTIFGARGGANSGGPYVLPIGGPLALGSIIAAFDYSAVGALLIVDGTVQLGGIIVMLVGAARH